MNNYSNEIPFNLDLIEVKRHSEKKKKCKVCIYFLFSNMIFFTSGFLLNDYFKGNCINTNSYSN
jgi:hypothetical protein